MKMYLVPYKLCKMLFNEFTPQHVQQTLHITNANFKKKLQIIRNNMISIKLYFIKIILQV
uniref:Uncharacterized protein n=1 Tax=Meloidogyne enterolobii TaxID=390850 RepID=A0A6V7UM65_MELEN|nr:unnamed protein product [Meloidogyne enterolobii]